MSGIGINWSDIDVLSINGRSLSTLRDYLISSTKEYHLAPGEYEIAARYSTFWEFSPKNFRKLRSNIIFLTFNGEAGGIYRLTHPRLRSIHEAERFANNPDIWIEKTGKASEMATETKSEGIKVSQPVEVKEQERRIEPKSPSIEPKRSYTQPERPPAVKSESPLRDDWNNLSDEEKQQFREWLRWNNMSKEEKEKFREWSEESDKE